MEILQRWEYQTILPAFWEICMQVEKQQLKLNLEQLTGSTSGKEYIKAVYWMNEGWGALLLVMNVLK